MYSGKEKIHGNDKHQIQEKREGNGMGRDMQRTSTGFVIIFSLKNLKQIMQNVQI